MDPKRVPLPPHVVVHREPGAREVAGDPYRSPGVVRDDLLIEMAWRPGLVSGVIGFQAVWWSVLALFWVIAFAVEVPWPFLAAIGLFTLIGCSVAYWVLAQLVNRTVVTLEGEMLSVRHGPLPWRRAVAIPAVEIEQLFVREGVAYEVNNVPVPGFSVIALVRDGREEVVARNLPLADQARYLEWVVEDALRVVDRPVPGERARGQ